MPSETERERQRCAAICRRRARLVTTRAPVLVGEGIPLFEKLDADVKLRHVATRDYPSGLVQSEYTVVS